jgi:hypothetical protein
MESALLIYVTSICLRGYLECNLIQKQQQSTVSRQLRLHYVQTLVVCYMAAVNFIEGIITFHTLAEIYYIQDFHTKSVLTALIKNGHGYSFNSMWNLLNRNRSPSMSMLMKMSSSSFELEQIELSSSFFNHIYIYI